MVEWLNPEDPKKNIKKSDSLARYLWYSQNNIVRGFFGLPCLLCHRHAVRINYLIKKPDDFGWDSKGYHLVNKSSMFFEDHLLPSDFHVVDFQILEEED